MLRMLHEYFTKVDMLLEKANVFKYQTIGDAFLVSSISHMT